MHFSLPELSFDPTGFGSWSSVETFNYHHGKHHAGYVKKLNAAIENTDYADMPLVEIIASSRDKDPNVFNNAAQHFNHEKFWESLSPDNQNPSSKLMELIERDFGSFDDFKERFKEQASTLFGSGWTWLIQTPKGSLEIRQYGNAETPAGTDNLGLLPLDVWEHAYYIDHRNERGKFIDGFWEHINWYIIEERLV